jgi:hypothetical protein
MNTHPALSLRPVGHWSAPARRGGRSVICGVVMFAAAIVWGARVGHAQMRIEAEAYAGAPFGVGRITLTSGNGVSVNINRIPRPGGGRIAELTKKIISQAGNRETANLESAEMTLSEKSDRALYPVFDKRDRPILRQFVSVPTATTILFLFQGDAPLDLTIHAPGPFSAKVVPRQDRAGYDRLLQAWWRDYSSAAEGRDVVREYPPMVEEYLTDTLARRLRLNVAKRAGRDSSVLQKELNLLFETETVRLELAQSILLGELARDVASESLPEELPEPKPELLNPPAADTPIEPIASRVPVECLYVRFGNFPNFLWLRHRMDDWGGELRNLISERGLDFGLNDRFQRQIGLRESALAEVLGERVIADVAIIGSDTFVREGAAMGMLFHAKNTAALTADLTQQRAAALREAKGGRQEQLTIGGHEVSFFSTSDNSLRSFYAVDGDFHLVTTSRALVERFLATGANPRESLAGSDEFRFTRANIPLSQNDTIFVYLSPQFFQNLLSPRYQIELNRRLASAVEMELLEIAKLAARAEKKPGGTIEDLVAGDLLPAGFGQRPDGSRLELVDGKIIDSLRGGRGTFVPVPDVDVDKVTLNEVRTYGSFAEDYTTGWGAMDPLVARVQRQTMPDGKLERVAIDLQAAPLAPQHIELLSKWLGEPTDQRLAQIPGNTVWFEAVMRGGTFFPGGDHHLFGALRDADPAIALDPRPGLIARLVTSQFEGLQGYLGAWPNPGLLRLLSGLLDAPPDAAGYSRSLSGVWRRQVDDFTLLSFHPEILQKITPQLRFEKAPRPAQVWFRADDLLHSQLAGMINAYGYRQSRQITSGNTRFLNMLSEQLHVPPAECLGTAERLLGAKFASPLGGRYELREYDGGLKTWVDAALADRDDASQPPADYQFPALTWLRGVDLELSVHDGALAARGEVIMPVETRSGFQLPNFNFGGQKPPLAKKPDDQAKGQGTKAAKPQPPRPAPPAPSGAKRSGKREF